MTRPLPAALVSGQPVTRVDGRLKVTGRAMYAADNPAKDLVYGALVCSTVARGAVERIDPAAAVRDRDVLRVLTDFGGVKLPYDIRQVSCLGQPVAVVVATTLEAAMHGASLVEVKYRPGPQLTNIDAPQAEQKPGSRTRDYARGNADDELRAAAVATDLRYSIMRNNHNPMEIPATVASWDGDRLTVWDKVQSISGAQKTYADAFGVPGDQVRVISPFVGGAFGSAGTVWPHQLLAAFAARKIRRPVKLMLTRKQYYSGIGFRPTSRQRMAIGADRSGRVGAIVHEAHTETSRYNAYEDNLMTGARFLYGAPNMRSTYRVVPLDINPPTYMRGPGATTGAFALESAMDDLAFRLGMDPVELRMRNEPDRDLTDNLPFSTRRLTDCFRQGADRFGWVRRNPTPRATRDGNQLIGIGTAAAVYHTSRSECAALARINADGTADIQCGTSDMGPGTYTSMTQVAADALGLPFNRVRFALGDSRFPTAPSHSGSRTMASVGSAVFTTANMLRDRFV
ncbi:MAG TPA: xanthine dehydrogenase family protein molybdopterin-binding subunit, partial [Mycobacterium sp.]|nr:xanthine dehydrogenase family protein molybdopterin-binding subunit [Mycobacterium sp.]